MGTNVPRALRELLLEYYSRDNSNSRTLLIQISEHCRQGLEPKLKQASTCQISGQKNNQFFNVAKKLDGWCQTLLEQGRTIAHFFNLAFLKH